MSIFFKDLRDYFGDIATVLRGQASAASIFPNRSDIGQSREAIYAEMLRQHLPSSTNVFLGGFLFGMDGAVSGQIDIIVLNDSAVQFNFNNPHGSGKAFGCVDGTVCTVSCKSNLDSAQMRDSLRNISTIPDKQPLDGRVPYILKIKGYEDWPLKVMFSQSGMTLETTLQQLNLYYEENPDIPINKRPNVIHALDRFVIVRVGPNGGETRDGTKIAPNSFHGFVETSGAYGLLDVISSVQDITQASKFVKYTYKDLINKMPF